MSYEHCHRKENEACKEMVKADKLSDNLQTRSNEESGKRGTKMSVEVRIKKSMDGFRLNVQFLGQSRRIGILGASGCGKSMTLKSIAGIETPHEGYIRIDHKVLLDTAGRVNLKPQNRNIGYLFQNYALFPAMTTAENIAAGLKKSKAENKKRVEEIIDKFRLSGLENRLPAELSGGQQQRVALARIMAYQPDVILLDEPFSAMDVFLRDQMQRELMEMLQDYLGTVIMVSHSRDEIYRFSEEILVLDQGADVIYGKTKEIFANPIYREAARLTGCKNFSDIRKIDSHTIEAQGWGIRLHLDKEVPEYADCIGFRAHDFAPVWGDRPKNGIRVRLADMAALPFETNYYILPQGSCEAENVVCWFVQRELLTVIKEKGLPDYLEVREDKILYLKK